MVFKEGTKPQTKRFRYRICGTPVRTGCITCRIRRVKCDEAKPFCGRCTSTGRKCDGYEDLSRLPRKKKSVVKSRSPTSPSEPTGSLIRQPQYARPIAPSLYDACQARALSFRFSGSESPARHNGDAPRDALSYKHFCSSSLASTSAHFFSDFWTTTVVQTSYAGPVGHGISALAALHKDMIQRSQHADASPGVYLRDFALRRYTDGIAALHIFMATWPSCLDLPMVACILYVSYNCLVSNYDSAFLHLKAGLKIHRETQERHVTRGTLLTTQERGFAPILLALSVELISADENVGRVVPEDVQMALWQAGIFSFVDVFSTLHQARHGLDTLKIMLRQPLPDMTLEHPSIADPMGALQRWYNAYSVLLEALRATVQSDRVWQQAEMLKLHYLKLCDRSESTRIDDDRRQSITSSSQTSWPTPCELYMDLALDLAMSSPSVVTPSLSEHAPDRIWDDSIAQDLAGAAYHWLMERFMEDRWWKLGSYSDSLEPDSTQESFGSL